MVLVGILLVNVAEVSAKTCSAWAEKSEEAAGIEVEPVPMECQEGITHCIRMKSAQQGLVQGCDAGDPGSTVCDVYGKPNECIMPPGDVGHFICSTEDNPGKVTDSEFKNCPDEPSLPDADAAAKQGEKAAEKGLNKAKGVLAASSAYTLCPGMLIAVLLSTMCARVL